MAQARVGAQRPQQRVLEDVLRALVVGHPPRVGEQLVAVALDERPERGEGEQRSLPYNVAGLPM